jgi:hypothetical protein
MNAGEVKVLWKLTALINRGDGYFFEHLPDCPQYFDRKDHPRATEYQEFLLRWYEGKEILIRWQVESFWESLAPSKG